MRARREALRRLAARLLAAALFAAGMLGCAAKTPPTPPPIPVRVETGAPVAARDVLALPQSVAAYCDPAAFDVPVLPQAEQTRLAARLRERHFAPWHRTAPAHSRADAMWGLAAVARREHFGENLQPLGPEFLARMTALSQPDAYPNTLRPAIATANTSLRVLPTDKPGFLDPSLPGEGYPFDYWQNSGLLAGTPLFVAQLSADGAWAFVEGRVAAGWVPVRDIGYVDAAFMARWEALPLAAITRENAPVAASFPGDGGRAEHLFAGRIGTLLPLLDMGAGEGGGPVLLAPARREDGQAASVAVRMEPDTARAVPIPFTPRNFAALADQLVGQPYGWGGYLGNRDCSAMVLDLYAPFGIFMPRNSSLQARQGQWMPWVSLLPEEKEAMLRQRGAPLLTLIHKPGHIMLYLGQHEGRAVILHDLWGLRTLDAAGKAGRYVVGRVSITTLTPGAEIPDVERSGLLLPLMDGMTLVAPARPAPQAAGPADATCDAVP